MLKLQEDSDRGYGHRTEVNVEKADITFAIAIDFKSGGEILTKKLAQKHNKMYIPVHPSGSTKEKADKIVPLINKRFESDSRGIELNIAGNGIYTMNGNMTQEQCDEFTYSLLKDIVEHSELKVKIKRLRSGGQSGFDESGIKAGLRLKLETTAYMPKGFRIKDLDGDKTLTKEETFKRFGIVIKNKMMVDLDDTLCDYSGLWKIYKQKFPDVAFPQSKFGFFSRLKPIPGALEALKELSEYFEIYILTKPSVKNLHSYSEKAEWVERYLGEEYLEKLILCPDKSLVRGDFLVDDWDKNGQTEFEGEFLHFKTERFPEWESVKKYLLDKKC